MDAPQTCGWLCLCCAAPVAPAALAARSVTFRLCAACVGDRAVPCFAWSQGEDGGTTCRVSVHCGAHPAASVGDGAPGVW